MLGIFLSTVYSHWMLVLSPEQIQFALDEAARGTSLRKIQLVLGVNAWSFWKYRQNNEGFSRALDECLSIGIDSTVDKLLDITEEIPDVAEARLISDNIRWVASKRKPSVYGERLDVNVLHVDISVALEEAKRRALGREVVAALPKPKTNGHSGEIQVLPTGCQPVDDKTAPQLGRNAGLAAPCQNAPKMPYNRHGSESNALPIPKHTPNAATPYKSNKRKKTEHDALVDLDSVLGLDDDDPWS